MENTTPNPTLMKVARERVNFKAHLIIFILGNVLLWLLWILLYYIFSVTFPWALFPTLIWGVALLYHYFVVYKWNEKWIAKEYNKLLEESRNDKTNSQLPPTINA